MTTRFDNPAIRHRTAQIALDGSQKLPQRILATAFERAREGAAIDHLMLVPAAWIAACEARGKALAAGLFSDPLDAELATILSAQPSAQETVQRVFDAAGFTTGRPDAPKLIERAARHLGAIRTGGVERCTRSPERKTVMRQTWRWFGPDDLVQLSHVKQAGAVGIVTALHHLNDGRAWPADEIAQRKAEIEAAGLTWDIVESIIVHEDIETRGPRYRELIENYKASIRAVAAAGIKVVCYNFMAITDWTRTDLEERHAAWRHGAALRHRRFLRL